ncbi:enhancer of polycomb-like-domain-containing protein [Mycena leptocephala]|nr:enhancer of polycomb-like-domain-containing protein [Mycena leptocephala]
MGIQNPAESPARKCRWVLDYVLVLPPRRARSDASEQPAPTRDRVARRRRVTRRVHNDHPLKIMRGDRGADLNDARDETAAVSAYVDLNERKEHHLQAVLAMGGEFIPTPRTTQVPYEYYTKLYPPAKWKDPVSYVETPTVEAACGNVLAGDGCTYYMDEEDKEWLDKNNRQARGESSEDKDPNIGVPISISEDEFELVMGLLEKFTDQQVLEGDGLDFSLYQRFFSAPLPDNMFISCTVPSWVPPPTRLVCIVHNIYPHWKYRRLRGRIRPSLNDFPDPAYECFRKRDSKPFRKSRALAHAPLLRENVRKAESHIPWNTGGPLAHMLPEAPPPGTPESIEHKLSSWSLPPSDGAPDSATLGPKRPRTASVERKEARAQRNRIAAQNSRDRRKAQFCWLERRVSELEEENRRLRAGFPVAPAQPDSPRAERLQKENAELRERIQVLENGWTAVLTALAGGLSTGKAPSASAPASEPPPYSSVFR